MGINLPELIVILIVVLILFGPGKLPDIGKAIGQAIREFKRAQRDFSGEGPDPAPPPAPPAGNPPGASGDGRTGAGPAGDNQRQDPPPGDGGALG